MCLYTQHGVMSDLISRPPDVTISYFLTSSDSTTRPLSIETGPVRIQRAVLSQSRPKVLPNGRLCACVAPLVPFCTTFTGFSLPHFTPPCLEVSPIALFYWCNFKWLASLSHNQASSSGYQVALECGLDSSCFIIVPLQGSYLCTLSDCFAADA